MYSGRLWCCLADFSFSDLSIIHTLALHSPRQNPLRSQRALSTLTLVNTIMSLTCVIALTRKDVKLAAHASSMAKREDGRRQGQGDALEREAQNLLHELGFKTERSVFVRGFEVDVIGVNEETFPVRLCGECKDWVNKEINPSVIFRLVSVSSALHAHPILFHNSELSDRAKDACMGWGVRCVNTNNMEPSTLPIPEPVDEERFSKIPDLIEDTLPAVAQIKQIYDPFHPAYRTSRFSGWHD